MTTAARNSSRSSLEPGPLIGQSTTLLLLRR
jgi:hypothetical protein